MYEVRHETLYYDGWGNFYEKYFNNKDEAVDHLEKLGYRPSKDREDRWFYGNSYASIVPSDITRNAKSYIVILNLDGTNRIQVSADSMQGAVDYIKEYFPEYEKISDSVYEYRWTTLNKEYVEYVYIQAVDRINQELNVYF